MLRTCCLLLAVVCWVQLAPSDPAVSHKDHHPEDDWTYDTQLLWPQMFEACGGPRQSPTRLDAELVELGGRPELTFAPGLADGRVHAINTGHTLQLQLSTVDGAGAGTDTCTDTDINVHSAVACNAVDASDEAVSVVTLSASDSPLAGTYKLEQLHFHWGDSQGSPGSEHALNGQLADAEAHFVFFNRLYGNISEAAQMPDGLAVIGILLEGSEAGHEPGKLTWPPLGLEGRLSDLAEVGSELTVPADLTLLRPLLQQAVSKVFSYRGSLTTPPCSPVVSWLVAEQSVMVDGKFLDELRSSLYRDSAGHHLQNNRRWLQLRQDRLVIKHLSFE